MNGICNYELLAQYGKEIKGKKTISELTEASNLSRSFLSKLINQNLLSVPSKRSLKNLALLSNGKVTYSQLLEAAGYSTSSEEESDESDESISFEKAVYEHYLVKPAAAALQLLISVLATFGIKNNIQIDYSTDCIKLSCNSIPENIICLPAFCFGEKEIQGISFAVLRKLIDIVTSSDDGSHIYILTDNNLAFDTFKQMIPPIEKCKIDLLYTADYKNINIQYDLKEQKDIYILAKKAQTKSFSGVFAIK